MGIQRQGTRKLKESKEDLNVIIQPGGSISSSCTPTSPKSGEKWLNKKQGSGKSGEHESTALNVSDTFHK